MNLTTKISRHKLDQNVARYASDLRTLEVGAFGSPSYRRFFPNRVGVDIRKDDGVDIVASVYKLPFKDGEFDNVLCMVVLEHLEDPRTAIAEMRRVLKPGGQIIVSVPFLFPMHDTPNDFWRFTKYGLQSLFKDWDIVELKAETGMNESFAVLIQRVGFQTKLHFNTLMKVIIFSLARVISWLPNFTRTIYGSIEKTNEEPDAFTSSFFLVARKR